MKKTKGRKNLPQTFDYFLIKTIRWQYPKLGLFFNASKLGSYNSLKTEKKKNKKPRIAIESSISSKQANEFVTFRNISQANFVCAHVYFNKTSRVL